MVKGGAAAGLACMWPVVVPAQDAVTTVFTGGKVLTVDADFSQADAIAIRGNRILAVGSNTEVSAAAGSGAQMSTLMERSLTDGPVESRAGTRNL
jgi:predicted amidohydrolase YtcJ